MKILIFDLWGDFGHFRIPYTPSSPLTFPVPPKTALYGIIGAILGYDKNEYLLKFNKEKWEFSISLNKPIKKTYIPENFINTKEAKMFSRMPKNKSCRTQINLEFLKSPSFRIYVYSKSDEFYRLESFLKEHKSVFTVTLGLSECIANFKYVGTYDFEEIKNNKDIVEISTIIPIKENIKIQFLSNDNKERKYLKIRLPLEMKEDRELIKIQDFVIEANGESIFAQINNYINLKNLNKNIILF
ncbi:MAG: type I-B CRISPR-associated protein Cas5 [Fusobacteriia bacterium 4572_132]|nr:MAG: type I-B CRISPR-associated protein Cas5 [Fusobacteriia bacterium 4572_132]